MDKWGAINMFRFNIVSSRWSIHCVNVPYTQCVAETNCTVASTFILFDAVHWRMHVVVFVYIVYIHLCVFMFVSEDTAHAHTQSEWTQKARELMVQHLNVLTQNCFVVFLLYFFIFAFYEFIDVAIVCHFFYFLLDLECN